MKFWDLTPDEREQWGKDDVTRAYVEQLKEMRLDALDSTLASMRIGNHKAAQRLVGSCDGLLDAIHVAEDVK